MSMEVSGKQKVQIIIPQQKKKKEEKAAMKSLFTNLPAKHRAKFWLIGLK